MVEQWELAKTIIDAKKAVDSLWFISENLPKIYDVQSLCFEKRSFYFINLCAVLDNSICIPKGSKKELCDKDGVVQRIYYERDKYYAHKDKNYKPSFPFASLKEETFSLQNEILHIATICKEFLPNELTFDFVCYDERLFRQINNILPVDEEQIFKIKHPFNNFLQNSSKESEQMKVLRNIEDLRLLSEEERKDYCTVLENGLTWEEGLHNRQDWAIKTNILYNKNIWVSINHENWNYLIKQREIGLFNKFGIPNILLYPFYLDWQLRLLSIGNNDRIEK